MRISKISTKKKTLLRSRISNDKTEDLFPSVEEHSAFRRSSNEPSRMKTREKNPQQNQTKTNKYFECEKSANLPHFEALIKIVKWHAKTVQPKHINLCKQSSDLSAQIKLFIAMCRYKAIARRYLNDDERIYYLTHQ